jgi:hypothetical protein
MGRPILGTMGLEPGLFDGRPRDLSGCAESANAVDVVGPPPLPPTNERRNRVRAIGVDVHLEFCEVAIAEDGELRSAGRIETKPEQIELFARSLGSDDRVALEVIGTAREIKRMIDPHVGEVVVVSPPDTGAARLRPDTRRLPAARK